jgi:PAS domain S-box-containing protein
VDNAFKGTINGKPYEIDHRIILYDGEERTVHIQAEVVFNDKNIPIQTKGIIQDITERKEVEERLRESEEKYRDIVETANEGILTIDDEAKITYANTKLTEITGYTLGEAIGRPIWDFISEESKPIVQINLEKRMSGISESYELRLKCKDVSLLWTRVNSKPLFDKYGIYKGSLSLLTDITKRKEAEATLKNIEIARKQEIHHRIKNNLQVISSLLDLQAEKFKGKNDIKDYEVLEAFRESQDRVISMALIHEELYRGGEIDKLNSLLILKNLLTIYLSHTGLEIKISA